MKMAQAVFQDPPLSLFAAFKLHKGDDKLDAILVDERKSEKVTKIL